MGHIEDGYSKLKTQAQDEAKATYDKRREKFALAALTGLLSNTDITSTESWEEVATKIWLVADLILQKEEN